MSIDTYFCFCCMSTNDLTNLFSYNNEDNYADMMKDLCSLCVCQPDQKDYEDDCYICRECSNRLENAVSFKNLVFTTLNVLQGNGLITLYKVKNTILVKKVSEEEENKDELKFMYVGTSQLDYKLDDSKDETQTIKSEQNETCVKETETHIALKNEKKFTVARKRKREVRAKQKEPSYSVTEDLICSICSEKLPNAKVFHSHMNGHYPNHICETCGKGFLTEKRLKRHKPSHDKGPFSCTQCDAVFTNYNTYNSHRQRKHSTTLLYRCPQCSERFATFTRRARHLAATHGKRDTYACPACPKRFLVSGNLTAHIRNTHARVARHRCPQCALGYYHRQELRAHMSSHTGLHQYHCTHCSKSYPRKNALDVHMRTHTGDKRFGCDVCGKRFTQKCTLTKHYKMHLRTREDKEMPTLVIGVDTDSLNYVLS